MVKRLEITSYARIPGSQATRVDEVDDATACLRRPFPAENIWKGKICTWRGALKSLEYRVFQEFSKGFGLLGIPCHWEVRISRAG